MARLGYHCSLEQFSPEKLLNYALKAQTAGFKHLSCSDHFAPWSSSQGHSSNAWCWMGAALAKTGMSCGTVCAPHFRYNVGIVAQMVATLERMFPGKVWLALGSGEYLNEHFTTKEWPAKSIRNEMLEESVACIQKLLQGKEVSKDSYIKINKAKLYTFPDHSIPLLGAALSPQTAQFLAPFTDGLITVGPYERVREVVKAYRQHGGASKLLFLKLDLSFAKSREQAIQLGWEQWRYTQVEENLLADLKFPSEFEDAAKQITQGDFAEKVNIVTSPAELEELIQKYAELGFEQINLHNVNKEQEPFLKACLYVNSRLTP